MIFGKKHSEQRDRIIQYKKTFSSVEGKAVLYDLMNRFHILGSHEGDPFAEGQRSVVLHVLHQYGVNLGEFDKLLAGETE